MAVRREALFIRDDLLSPSILLALHPSPLQRYYRPPTPQFQFCPYINLYLCFISYQFARGCYLTGRYGYKNKKKQNEPLARTESDDIGSVHNVVADGHGYDMGYLYWRLSNRQIQLIACGGSIGTTLFISIGSALATSCLLTHFIQ